MCIVRILSISDSVSGRERVTPATTMGVLETKSPTPVIETKRAVYTVHTRLPTYVVTKEPQHVPELSATTSPLSTTTRGVLMTPKPTTTPHVGGVHTYGSYKEYKDAHQRSRSRRSTQQEAPQPTKAVSNELHHMEDAAVVFDHPNPTPIVFDLPTPTVSTNNTNGTTPIEVHDGGEKNKQIELYVSISALLAPLATSCVIIWKLYKKLIRQRVLNETRMSILHHYETDL